MNEIEAKRIAAVVSVIRPEWRHGLIMAVLGDDNIRHRVYEDVLVAMVACYTDPMTGKPGRIHEPGKWWLTVTAKAPDVAYRVVTDNDCAICGRVAGLHSPLSNDPHEWEPQHARVKGVGPTPEQRAVIDKAAQEAAIALTAAKEAAAEREMRDPEEVIASHLAEKKTT